MQGLDGPQDGFDSLEGFSLLNAYCKPRQQFEVRDPFITDNLAS